MTTPVDPATPPGPTLRAVTVGDEPDAWRRAGFAVDGDRVTIGPLVVELTGGTERGLTGWVLGPSTTTDDPAAPPDGAGPDPGTIDGIATRTVHDRTGGIGGRDDGDGPDRPHPNGIVGVDHLVVRSPDLDRTVAALSGLGFRVRRTRDVPGSEPPLRQVFGWLGPVILELVGGAEPDPDRTGPATLWGLALIAADIDATADYLGPRLTEPRGAVQPGRRIAAFVTDDLDISVPLAVMTPHRRP
ncbi:MAG: glyoxalase [Acidimicrobiales bacterium]